METPFQVTAEIDGVIIPAFTTCIHQITHHEWRRTYSIGGLEPPGHAPCVQVDRVNVIVIGPKKDMPLGNPRRGADGTVGVIRPNYLPGAGTDNMQTFVL